MSDMPPPGPPPPPPIAPGPPPPPVRSGCVTAILIVIGIILLLPGLCALIFGGMAWSDHSFEDVFNGFVTTGLVIGGLGILLIWYAIRRP